jgi:hypothetical protein
VDEDGSPLEADNHYLVPSDHKPTKASAKFGKKDGQTFQYSRLDGRRTWTGDEALLLYRTVQKVPDKEENPLSVVDYLHGEFGTRSQLLRDFNKQHMKEKMYGIVKHRLGRGLKVEGRARKWTEKSDHPLREAYEKERKKYRARSEEKREAKAAAEAKRKADAKKRKAAEAEDDEEEDEEEEDEDGDGKEGEGQEEGGSARGSKDPEGEGEDELGSPRGASQKGKAPQNRPAYPTRAAAKAAAAQKGKSKQVSTSKNATSASGTAQQERSAAENSDDEEVDQLGDLATQDERDDAAGPSNSAARREIAASTSQAQKPDDTGDPDEDTPLASKKASTSQAKKPPQQKKKAPTKPAKRKVVQTRVRSGSPQADTVPAQSSQRRPEGSTAPIGAREGQPVEEEVEPEGEDADAGGEHTQDTVVATREARKVRQAMIRRQVIDEANEGELSVPCHQGARADYPQNKNLALGFVRWAVTRMVRSVDT